MTTVLSVPLVREQRPQAGVANMPGPGDALGAQHAFLSGAEPGDRRLAARVAFVDAEFDAADADRSEEHTSELQSLMRISYAVFCLKKKKKIHSQIQIQP